MYEPTLSTPSMIWAVDSTHISPASRRMMMTVVAMECFDDGDIIFENEIILRRCWCVFKYV